MRSLVRGHPGRWRCTFDDMLRLPGSYELIDGWLHVRRT
jgi:hypothetical protein